MVLLQQMPDIWVKRLINVRWFNQEAKDGPRYETRRGGILNFWQSLKYGIKERVLACKATNHRARCGIQRSSEDRRNKVPAKCEYCDTH